MSPAGRNRLQAHDPYPLNEKQNVIADAFADMMCDKNNEKRITHIEFAPQFALCPYPLPVAYTGHIFQMAYGFYSKPNPDLRALRMNQEVRKFENQHDVEIVFDVFHGTSGFEYPNRPLGLAIFDMDSTLIDQEVIDELARTNGIVDAVADITRRAMEGEIDFTTSLQERVGMLKGVKADVWEDLKTKVTIAKGAKELIAGLKQRGVLTGVISGGFIPMAEWLKGELGLNFAFANHVSLLHLSKLHPCLHHVNSCYLPALPCHIVAHSRLTHSSSFSHLHLIMSSRILI